jgi:hypothetical protein
MVGCGPRWPEKATPDALVDVLRDAGADAARSEEAAPEAFGVPGSTLLVNREAVWVYSFADAASRQSATGRLSADGMALDGQPLAWPGDPSIWAVDRLLVVYAGLDGATVLLLYGLLGDPLMPAAAEEPEPYPPGVTVAIGMVAAEAGIPPQSVAVTSFDARTWPDSCLGLPAAGEACAQAAVPGWRVILAVDSTTIAFRTDEVGAIVRREP